MKVTLDHVEEIAKNIRTFWFKPEKTVKYSAGQFVELRVPHDDKDKRGDKRWFTLSSSPTEPLVSITTKFAEESSSFKKALSQLKTGDQIDMSSPMGDFTLPKEQTANVLFVAGGIGCTPFRSMVKYVADSAEKRSIHVLYAANAADEVAFKPLFEQSTDGISVILSNPPTGWSGLTGRLDAATILKTVSDRENDMIYLSGPKPMVEALEKDLKDQGFNKKHILSDFFPGYTEI